MISALNSQDESTAAEGLEQNRKQIETLMELESFKLSAKALNLSFDQENLLISSSSIIDIRPVYDDPRQEILGGVVLHSIKLEFIQDGERKAITFGLDEDDIDSLISKLKLSKQKSKAAKKLFGDRLGLDTFIVGEETYGF